MPPGGTVVVSWTTFVVTVVAGLMVGGGGGAGGAWERAGAASSGSSERRRKGRSGFISKCVLFGRVPSSCGSGPHCCLSADDRSGVLCWKKSGRGRGHDHGSRMIAGG